MLGPILSATLLACAVLMLSACFAAAKPSGAISGTAFYGNAPLPGALISLTSGASAVSQIAGADGTYLFQSLAAGRYTLTVTSERWSVEGAVSLAVQVAHAQVAAPAARLTPAGALSGTLTQSPAIDLTGAIVSAGPLTAYADANGAFDFGRVPAAHYALTAVGTGRVTAVPLEVVVQVEALTQVIVPLITQEAPPPHVNHPPVVSPLQVTAVASAPSNPQPLLLVPDLPTDQITPGGVLHFVCPASDPDGDPLTIAWQVSGGLVASAGADAIDWTAAADSATISCLVSDGQGGLASQVLSVSVFDFRYIGAALSPTTIAAARTNATQASSDIFLQDRTSGTVTQLATPANESQPQLRGSTLAYLSDENATAENPLDVYVRSPQTAAPVRVTTTAGAEIFSLAANAIYVANGATLTAYAASATPILPNPGSAVDPGAAIDRIVAGVSTVLFRQSTTLMSQWSGVRLSDGEVFNLTLDPTAAVSWDGTRYLAADPVSQQVTAIPDALPVITPVLLAPLAPLSSPPFPTVMGDASGFAFANVDSSGLFTPITFGSHSLAVSAPSAVLGVSARAVLVGTPTRVNGTATDSLSLWQVPP